MLKEKKLNYYFQYFSEFWFLSKFKIIFKINFVEYSKNLLIYTDFKVNSFLSGLYFGNDWTQTSYSSNIVDSGRQLDVTVNGKFDYYILINTSLTSFAG